MPFAREDSHSLPGLLWFCLPVSFALYLLFHVLLKGPLLGLLPSKILARLGSSAAEFQTWPAVPWAAVLVSLAGGAVTHVLWDAFTHDPTPVVASLTILRTRVASVGTYPIPLYMLLQHASTVVGLGLLAWWSLRWLRRAPVCQHPLPLALTPRARVAVLLAIVCLAVGMGAWSSAQVPLTGISAGREAAGRAVFTAMPALAASVVIYSIAWHAVRLRRETARLPS